MTMRGAICTTRQLRRGSAVHWCESASGEFSNAVNITVSDEYCDIILVSPAQPVSQGDSVTLRCTSNTGNTPSSAAAFYHNDKLIQSDSRELKIPAVSKSDEGFYKCRHKGSVSAQSWMSVKENVKESSSFPELSIILLICGTLLIILLLLLLLLRYRCDLKPTSLCCNRRGNPSAATDQPTANHEENQQHLYSALLHGEVCVYDSLRRSENSREVQALAQTPVVTLTPEWPKLYEQEMITLTCVIQGGGDAEWTYSWQTSSSVSPPDSDSYPMEAEVSHSGFYKCRGQSKGFTTEWSDPFKLEIHNYVPIPVLTVAPIWQSAGAPIMLTCQMEYPSAGWSFYWYEVLQHGRYEIQYTMMPGNGNEENSYVVYMPTSNTTSYVCRAGRGEPMYYSELSERTWAQGEFGNTINLTTNRPKPETPSVVAALFAGLVSAVVLMVLLMLLYRLLKFPDTNRNSDPRRFRCSTELD
uniref:uncharacterized protein LOC122766471 isoform X2 n=1 Tax=Solea senegalensis TaxID=28829 RepID=UPI001CD8F9FA|nr:uncharacterized protein LOC122766471 isoform X2 [Solea senegalensis]